MAIEIWNGSAWANVSDPEIYNGSNYVDIQKGEIYNGSSWSIFYNRFSGTTTAPSLSFNASTLYTVTINVSMNVAPAAGYTARVAVWNNTTGSAINAQYIPNLSGTTGTISGTYTSTGLSLNTSYQFAAYTEYLQGGTVVAASSITYFSASTRNTVLPTISISSKTDTSISVSVSHSDSLARRVVLFRSGSGGPDTRYNPSSTTYSTTNPINWTQTFSSLSNNTRYFFYAYVIYEEGTTTTTTVQTFTKTKWWSPQSSGYVAGNNSTYISSFGAHALYLSDSQSNIVTGVDSWFSGQEPAKASDGNTGTQWRAYDVGLQTTTVTTTRSINTIAASRSGFGYFNLHTTSTAHGLQTGTTATTSISAIRYTVSYCKVSVLGSTFVDMYISGTKPTFSNGDYINISFNGVSAYNRDWTVHSDQGSFVRLSASGFDTTTPQGNGGTCNVYIVGGNYITVYGAGPTSVTVNNSIEFYLADFDGVNLPQATAVGTLSYETPSSTYVTKASTGTASSLGNAERLVMGFKPNLSSSTTRNVYLEAVRFRVGSYPTSYLALSINGSSTYWNTSDSGGVDRIPVISQNTFQPNASYSAGGVGITNCFTLRFDMQRQNATCSMAEVQISYKWEELTDPGD